MPQEDLTTECGTAELFGPDTAADEEGISPTVTCPWPSYSGQEGDESGAIKQDVSHGMFEESDAESFEPYWCVRSPPILGDAQLWDHEIWVSGPDNVGHCFIVDEYTTIKELKKYISRYMGVGKVHIVADGDILEGSTLTHDLPWLHLVAPVSGAGQGDDAQAPPEMLAQVRETLAYVMYRCRYDFPVKDEDVYSGRSLRKRLARKTHVAQDRLELTLHGEPVYDHDLVSMEGGVTLKVRKRPPLETRTRRQTSKKRKTHAKDSEDEIAALDEMSDGEFTQELQRSSIIPGDLPACMVDVGEKASPEPR